MIGIDLTKEQGDPDYNFFVVPERKKPRSNDRTVADLAIARQFQEAEDFELARILGQELAGSSSSSSSSRRASDDNRTMGDLKMAMKFQEQADLEFAKRLSQNIVGSTSSSSSSDGQDSLLLARKLQSKEAREWQEEEDLQFAKQLRKYFEEDQQNAAGAMKQTAVVPVDLHLSAQQAMQYVTNKARNMSVAARPWCSDAVLNAAVATVQACDVVIHLNPTNVLRFLARDTQYRNHYEIGGGSGEVGGRYALENRMFGNAYQGASANHMPKYGCLNLFRGRRGDPQAKEEYGDSFLLLKSAIKERCTFTDGDSIDYDGTIATFEHCRHIVAKFTRNELQALSNEGGCHERVASVGGSSWHGRRRGYDDDDDDGDDDDEDDDDDGAFGGYMSGLGHGMFSHGPSVAGTGGSGDYKEVQIHGPVRLGQDVDALVLHERHKASPDMRRLAEEFGRKHQVSVLYMDDIAKWG